VSTPSSSIAVLTRGRVDVDARPGVDREVDRQALLLAELPDHLEHPECRRLPVDPARRAGHRCSRQRERVLFGQREDICKVTTAQRFPHGRELAVNVRHSGLEHVTFGGLAVCLFGVLERRYLTGDDAKLRFEFLSDVQPVRTAVHVVEPGVEL